ncbi:MAG: GIY-YIG nuclease family protein [bacterium]|nr:GIY-YIG nuclease family protein [bacterium]
MFCVYVLRSKKDKSFYIGFAINLKERLAKHNDGLVYSTKHILPMELLYCEAYKSKKDTLIREKRLKHFAKGFSSLKGRLKYSLMLQG